MEELVISSHNIHGHSVRIHHGHSTFDDDGCITYEQLHVRFFWVNTSLQFPYTAYY